MIKNLLTIVVITAIVAGLLAMDQKLNPAAAANIDWGIVNDNPVRINR
jgi:hypothetical protein